MVIEDVQVRTGNYYWRYGLSRDGQHAKVQISFRRNGVLTPQVLPVAGCDVTLGSEALSCVTLPAIAGAPPPEAITFPEDKPYLRAFYQDFMLPKVESVGATVSRIDHYPYRERYSLTRGTAHVVIDVVYKARGTITSIDRVKGDASLGKDVLEEE